jgi:nitrogenase molybdenum-cofactor synthesis protein NifE
MQERWQIPYETVSFVGIEETARALYQVATWFDHRDGVTTMMAKAKALVREEIARIQPELARYRQDLAGRSAALYVGGAFKAFSLVGALRQLGMRVVLAGTQTGGVEEYEHLKSICDEGTVIVDDSNPLELAAILAEQPVDLFIGGVKERPIAYKMGIGFCDHNHERKVGLAGFEGMVSFAKEVHATCCSPVWKWVREPTVAASSHSGVQP